MKQKVSSRNCRGDGRRPLQSRSAENLPSYKAGFVSEHDELKVNSSNGVGKSRSAQDLARDSERRELYSPTRFSCPADTCSRYSCRYGSGKRARSHEPPPDRSLSQEEIEYAVEQMHREFCCRMKGVVNGLPTGCREEDVDVFLEEYLCKTVSKLKDRSVRILFPTSEIASEQLQRLNSSRCEGCKLSAAYGHPDSLLFVGNLSCTYTNEDLMRLFQPHGDILRCFIVCSLSTGLSKGYGFVEFKTRDEAAQAKLQLATKVVGQRSLRVDFADNGMQTCEDLQSRTLFVDRLPKGFVEDEVLRDKFSVYGIVNFCQVALTSSGISRGFAFIDMSTWQEAETAQSQCNGALLSGHEIRVSFGMPCRPGACILQHKNSINIPFINGRPIGSTLHSMCTQKENIPCGSLIDYVSQTSQFTTTIPSITTVYKPHQPIHLDVNRPEFIPNPSFVLCGSLSNKICHSCSAPDIITSRPPSIPPSLPSSHDHQPITSLPSSHDHQPITVSSPPSSHDHQPITTSFTMSTTKSLTKLTVTDSHHTEPDNTLPPRVSRKRCAPALDNAVDTGLMAVYDRPYIGQHQQGIPFTHPLKRIKTSNHST